MIIIKKIILIFSNFYKNLLKKKFPDKRLFIFDFLKKNSICCEIGVWKGDFSNIIINNLKPKKIYLIDPWKDFGPEYFGKVHEKYDQIRQNLRFNFVKKRFQKLIKKKQVKLLKMTSKEAIKNFKKGYLDFVYIDGNHDYNFVKYDLKNYFYFLKSGGYLIGDDFRLKSVKKAVLEFIKQNNIKDFLTKNDQFVIKKY